MESKSVNLLRRVRVSSDQSAWQRLVDLYAPLIFYWGKADGLDPTDAVDQTIAGAPAADELELLHETEYQGYLASRALELMRTEFQTATWQACWQVVVDGHRAADVARDLGMTVNAVYVAKSRVLTRLREELEGLLE